MANLTISVPEHVLRRARIKALELGTSVNAYLRQQLESFIRDQRETQIAAAKDFLRVAERSRASSGATGRTWRRDDLYDR